MSTKEYILLAVGLFGGGLIVYFFELLAKRGKLKIDSHSLKLTYHHTPNAINYLISFDLDMQFVNSSGYSRIIKGLAAKFCYGNVAHELQFVGYNVPPAGVVDQKQVKCLQFELRAYEGNLEVPMLDIYDNTCFIEVTYYVGTKQHQLVIKGNDFILNDVTFQPAVF